MCERKEVRCGFKMGKGSWMDVAGFFVNSVLAIEPTSCTWQSGALSLGGTTSAGRTSVTSGMEKAKN